MYWANYFLPVKVEHQLFTCPLFSSVRLFCSRLGDCFFLVTITTIQHCHNSRGKCCLRANQYSPIMILCHKNFLVWLAINLYCVVCGTLIHGLEFVISNIYCFGTFSEDSWSVCFRFVKLNLKKRKKN